MQRQYRVIVRAEVHRDVDPAEGIGALRDRAGPERPGDDSAPRSITAAHDDARRRRGDVGVARRDDVDPLLPQHPGGCAGEAVAAGRIQHFDQDAPLARRDRVREPRLDAGRGVGIPAARRDRDAADDENRRADQREGDAETRLFQNRNVGSRIGHPDFTVYASRACATSRSTPREFWGNARASSARRSESNVRPGSR